MIRRSIEDEMAASSCSPRRSSSFMSSRRRCGQYPQHSNQKIRASVALAGLSPPLMDGRARGRSPLVNSCLSPSSTWWSAQAEQWLQWWSLVLCLSLLQDRFHRLCELTCKGCINLDHVSLLFPLVNSHLSLSSNSLIALSRTVAARLVPGIVALPNYLTVVVASESS